MNQSLKRFVWIYGLAILASKLFQDLEPLGMPLYIRERVFLRGKRL
jgi:hypothetical protein